MTKTRLMLEVEGRLGKPLEKLLPKLISELGYVAAAKRLGVSKATLNYWLLKLGFNRQRVFLQPGEEMVVRKIRRAE